jgi:adenylate cyclase
MNRQLIPPSDNCGFRNMSSNPERQLCAILFADTVAYTPSMARNEPRTAAIVKRQNNLAAVTAADWRGRVIRIRGDGMLLVFNSALDAVRFAQDLHRRITEQADHMPIRVGIHLGEVVFQDGDVYGADVNLASRIEPLAPPGGICLSANLWQQIRS